MRKRKTDELEFIKSQNFCSSKGTVVRMKRQESLGKKCLQSTWDKGLVSRIHKGVSQVNNRNYLIFLISKRFEQTLHSYCIAQGTLKILR